MFNILKLISMVLLVFINCENHVLAAPTKSADANAKAAMAKLQAMVKEATTARDTIKTEKDKISAELEQVKKEKDSANLEGERLHSELEAQKTSSAAVSDKLEQTHVKLLEVIDKYNALNKSKNELTVLNTNTQNTLKQTESNLQTCENKNIKLFEAAKEILSGYDNKSIFDAVLKEEPIFKFKSVEMESLVQEYEDKLRKAKFEHKDIIVNKTSAISEK